MSDKLVNQFKVLTFIGSLSIVTGLFSTYYTRPSTPPRYNLGVLYPVIGPYLQKIETLCKAYPESLNRGNDIIKLTEYFAYQYHKPSCQTPTTTRKILKVQRKLFRAVDKFVLCLSECIALDDVYKASDDFKQVITDTCLDLDR